MRRTNLIQGAAVSLATALVLVGVAGAQPSGSTGRPQGTPITGTGWTFTVPPGWQNLQPPQATPPSMIVSSVAAPRTSRGRFPNVNLVVEPFTGGDGAAYGQAALTAVQQVATVVDSHPASVGTRPGFELLAHWPNNRPPTQTLQRMAVSSGQAHVLTCTDTVEHFAQSAATCRQIVESFRVR